MNSITVDYLFGVKVRQSFLNLFLGSNRVIVCSESSIVRSDGYFFVWDLLILFQWSVAAFFQYEFVETFTAKFRFIRGHFTAAVCFTA